MLVQIYSRPVVSSHGCESDPESRQCETGKLIPPVALPFTLSGFTLDDAVEAWPRPTPKMNIPTFAENGSSLNAIWTAEDHGDRFL
jgi:hypothetical protein